jgi:hypothetical protein
MEKENESPSKHPLKKQEDLSDKDEYREIELTEDLF